MQLGKFGQFVILKSPLEPAGAGQLAVVNPWSSGGFDALGVPVVVLGCEIRSSQGGIGLVATREMLEAKLVHSNGGGRRIERTITFVGLSNQRRFRGINWAFDR